MPISSNRKPEDQVDVDAGASPEPVEPPVEDLNEITTAAEETSAPVATGAVTYKHEDGGTVTYSAPHAILDRSPAWERVKADAEPGE